MQFKKWLSENESYVSYTALVLHPGERDKLIQHVQAMIPDGWDVKSDHMTTNLRSASEGPASDFIGQEAKVTAKAIGSNQKVMAVAVDSEVPSKNAVKHITIATAPGAQSQESNNLTDWNPMTPLTIRGIVKEVQQKSEPKKIKPYNPSLPAPNDPNKFMELMRGKPQNVIRIALKGKFPGITDDEINSIMS